MSFNQPRVSRECWGGPGVVFFNYINLESKKIFVTNHKCGVTYYHHLFSRTYLNRSGYIDVSEHSQLGDWHLVVNPDEMQRFTKEHDEKEFRKLMITRNPYARVVSFFMNTFWDNQTPTQKELVETFSLHYSQQLLGAKFDHLVNLRQLGALKEGVEVFFAAVWNSSTPPFCLESWGYENNHLCPQSLACEGLTDVEFIDIHKTPPTGEKTFYVLNDFLGMKMLPNLPVNASSFSTNPSIKYRPHPLLPRDLTAFNEFYRDDFKLGYQMTCTKLQ